MKTIIKTMSARCLYKNKRLVNIIKNMTIINGTLRPAINNKHIKRIWLARNGNRYVGWSAITCERHHNDFKCDYDDNCYGAVGVFVRSRYRKHGIGRKLLDRAYKWAELMYGDYGWYDRRTGDWEDRSPREVLDIDAEVFDPYDDEDC